jgi:hypothetical protein
VVVLLLKLWRDDIVTAVTAAEEQYRKDKADEEEKRYYYRSRYLTGRGSSCVKALRGCLDGGARILGTAIRRFCGVARCCCI